MVLRLVALVVPLGLDTLVVAAAIGTLGPSRGSRLRVSVLFGAFEALMPLVGLGLGRPLSDAIGGGADLLAVGVLLAFGLWTLLGSEEREEESLRRLLDARGLPALALGVTISLDELAIGFTLGLLRLPAAVVIALIALQAFVVAQLGLALGARLGPRLREGAERAAGLMLTGLALALLAGRLL